MNKKTASLSQFAAKTKPESKVENAKPVRAAAGFVKISLKLSQDDWLAFRHFSGRFGMTQQKMLIEAVKEKMVKEGEKPIDGNY